MRIYNPVALADNFLLHHARTRREAFQCGRRWWQTSTLAMDLMNATPASLTDLIGELNELIYIPLLR